MNISTYDISQYNVKDGFYTLKSSDEVTHFKNGGVYVVLVIFVETQIWVILTLYNMYTYNRSTYKMYSFFLLLYR
jgi:hypothetical protein